MRGRDDMRTIYSANTLEGENKKEDNLVDRSHCNLASIRGTNPEAFLSWSPTYSNCCILVWCRHCCSDIHRSTSVPTLDSGS